MYYFLDTSYLVALTHKYDQHHAEAVKVSKSLKKPVRLVTSEAVLMEYGNILSPSKVREKAFRYIKLLQNDPATEIISIDTGLFEAGLADFGKYKDKEWGLVDCISFVIMRKKNMLYASTSDEHFEQAGFIIMLKS